MIVTRQALVRLAGGRARSPYVIAVTFRPGVDTAGAVARLGHRLSAVDENFFTQRPTTPTDLVNFGRIHGDVGRTVAWQATTLAVVTLVPAVPLGVAAGRTAWRLFAEQLGVVPDVSTPVALLALVVPATILLANVISIGPAVTAMRTHPASVLREE